MNNGQVSTLAQPRIKFSHGRWCVVFGAPLTAEFRMYAHYNKKFKDAREHCRRVNEENGYARDLPPIPLLTDVVEGKPWEP